MDYGWIESDAQPSKPHVNKFGIYKWIRVPDFLRLLKRDQAPQWIELSDVCGLSGRATMWYAVALMKPVPPTMFPATMPEFTRKKLEEGCKSIYMTPFVPLAFFYCSVSICPSSRKRGREINFRVRFLVRVCFLLGV